MSEPTYTLTLTESQRVALAAALGILVTKLTNCSIQIEAPAGGTQAARAILSPSTAPPAVAQSPAPIEQRDRWARDRKGNEVPNPDGCESHTIHLWKAEIVKRKDAAKSSFMKLAWDAPGGKKGSVDATCFDSNLFSYFLAALKQHQITLYTVRNGEYLNVVGVRA